MGNLKDSLKVALFLLIGLNAVSLSSALAQTEAIGPFGLTCSVGAQRFSEGGAVDAQFYNWGYSGSLKQVSSTPCEINAFDYFSLTNFSSIEVTPGYSMNVATNQQEFSAVFSVLGSQVYPSIGTNGVLSFTFPRPIWVSPKRKRGEWVYLAGSSWSEQCRLYPNLTGSIICEIRRNFGAKPVAYQIYAFPSDAYHWSGSFEGIGSSDIQVDE